MGLFQPVADMLKLLLKEDVIPGHVNKFLFVLIWLDVISDQLLEDINVLFKARRTRLDHT